MVTQERVKELLEYNPDTGEITWKQNQGRAVRGNRAGGLNCKSGYRQVSIDTGKYQEHRIIWLYVYGEIPCEIDHINHIRDDNRIANLRGASPAINAQNMGMKRNNTSGVSGVYWKKSGQKWAAHIRVNGAMKHLGYFISFEDAVAARKLAETAYGFHENHGIDVSGASDITIVQSAKKEGLRNHEKIYATNTSGFRGVRSRGDKWIAEISIKGKRKYLGIYAEKEDAIAARTCANEKYGHLLDQRCVKAA